MKNKVLPTIIGMNPPTKLVVCGREKHGSGYDCMIFHAEFENGTKSGDLDVKPTSVGGMSAWLHFTSAKAMLTFAEHLRNCALKAMEEEKKA